MRNPPKILIRWVIAFTVTVLVIGVLAWRYSKRKKLILKNRLIAVDYCAVDPRPLADYFKRVQPQLEEFREFVGDPPEGVLALRYYLWGDWSNSLYFAKIALAKRPDYWAAISVAKIALEGQNPNLLESMPPSGKSAIRMEYNLYLTFAKGDMKQGIEIVDKWIGTGAPYPVRYSKWPEWCLMKAKALSIMSDCSGVDAQFDDIWDAHIKIVGSFEELVRSAKAHERTLDQDFVARYLLTLCVYALRKMEQCHNSLAVEKWRARGLQLVQAEIDRYPDDLRLRKIILPQFKNHVGHHP